MTGNHQWMAKPSQHVNIHWFSLGIFLRHANFTMQISQSPKRTNTTRRTHQPRWWPQWQQQVVQRTRRSQLKCEDRAPCTPMTTAACWIFHSPLLFAHNSILSSASLLLIFLITSEVFCWLLSVLFKWSLGIICYIYLIKIPIQQAEKNSITYDKHEKLAG